MPEGINRRVRAAIFDYTSAGPTAVRASTRILARRPDPLFPLKLLSPIITAEYHGLRSETTIFQGIKSLFTHQQYFIGSLVFFTSILSPALKIIGLLFLPLSLGHPRWKRAQTWVYRIIRVIDPWNMLEVFLLAIAVAMIEMGRVATVHPGAGVFSFTAVVALTLLATLSFDPRLLWDSSANRETA